MNTLTISSFYVLTFAFILLNAQPIPQAEAPPSFSPPPFPQNQVSWQTAFLTLIPLALNSMTQPSTLDYKYPDSSLLFSARSSPIICLADTLEVIFGLCIFCSQTGDIHQAARLLNWKRVRSRLGEGVRVLEESAAEKHPKTFLVLFIVTLLQGIKIFGFEGLVWTKIWAGSYLGSFVVLVVVRMLPTEGWREDPPPALRPPLPGQERTTTDLFYYDGYYDAIRTTLIAIAQIAHYSVCSWAIFKVVHIDGRFIFNYREEPAPPFITACKYSLRALLLYRIFVILLNFVFLIDYCYRRLFSRRLSMGALLDLLLDGARALGLWIREICVEPERRYYFFFHSSVTFCMVMSTGILDIEGISLTSHIAEGVVTLLLHIGMLRLTLAFFIFVSKRFPGLHFLKPTEDVEKSYIVFPFLNFLVGFLYYHRAYMSEGTLKPWWTENLG